MSNFTRKAGKFCVMTKNVFVSLSQQLHVCIHHMLENVHFRMLHCDPDLLNKSAFSWDLILVIRNFLPHCHGLKLSVYEQ